MLFCSFSLNDAIAGWVNVCVCVRGLYGNGNMVKISFSCKLHNFTQSVLHTNVSLFISIYHFLFKYFVLKNFSVLTTNISIICVHLNILFRFIVNKLAIQMWIPFYFSPTIIEFRAGDLHKGDTLCKPSGRMCHYIPFSNRNEK